MYLGVVLGREGGLKRTNMLYTLLFWKYAETKSILCSHQACGVKFLIDDSWLPIAGPRLRELLIPRIRTRKDSFYHLYTNESLASKAGLILNRDEMPFEESLRVHSWLTRTEISVYDLKSKNDALRLLRLFGLDAMIYELFKPLLSQRKQFLLTI